MKPAAHFEACIRSALAQTADPMIHVKRHRPEPFDAMRSSVKSGRHAWPSVMS
jgi:hypothetical protein